MDKKGESNSFGESLDLDLLFLSLNYQQDWSTRVGNLGGLSSRHNAGERINVPRHYHKAQAHG
jgi:hypothetical protein